MKKLVRTSLNNVANKRGVRDLNIQLYSHDKNNAGFEFVIKNEVDLSEYKAKVLFDFQESFATWETKGTVEGNVVKVKFDTTFITKCEEVIGYLFLDSETDTLDVFKFKFNVVLSEIDKYDIAKRGFRYIKDQEVVDVITRSELQEELAKLQVNGGVDLSNYLTTKAAEEMYAKKSELPTPYNDSALVERVSNLENKTDNDTVYDDTPLKQRVEALETKVDKDTVYNDEEVKQRLTVLENKPTVDTSHFITDETLDSKNYLTTTVAEETYAKKTDLPAPYNDSALVQKIGQLEARVDKDTVYDDTSLKERVTALESKAIEGGAYDDTHLRERLDILEAKQDKDTVYDDAPLRDRVTTLENKAPVDLSNYVTEKKLEEKHYVTNEQISSTYATKSEIPQPYSDTELVKRITVLENKQDNDTIYDDTDLKNRVVALENNQQTNNGNSSQILPPIYEYYSDVATAKEHLDKIVVEGEGYNRAAYRAGIILAKVSGSNVSDFQIFKGDLKNEKFVDFDATMYSLANSLPDNYNLSSVREDINNRVLFLTNKNYKELISEFSKTSGGTQTQDTGWIKLSDETMVDGSIVEIRRIDNTVHVRFRNEQGNHFIVNPQIKNNTILTKQISAGFGSVVNNSLMILNENKSKSLGVVNTEVNNGNLQITIHITNSDYSNEFGVSVYINEFSYITDEPFPTNLH